MSPPPTLADARPEVVTRGRPAPRAAWIEATTAAEHKSVAKLFLGSALAFLVLAVVQFALMRVQLIAPDNTLINPEIFGRLVSASAVTAVVLFALPLLLGLIGYIVPLQVGARGVALPRLNQLSYWLYAVGALTIYASFLYSVSEAGTAALPPLSDPVFTPSHGVDAWVIGTGLAILGFVLFAVNLVVTLQNMRAPGMAWRRTPLFSWAAVVIGYTLLVIGPLMLAALTMLTIDRNFDGVFFDAGEGGAPLLYEHLAWIFYSGCYAIIVIGAAGIVSEIVPTFSRKPIFSRGAVAASLVAIAVLGVLAWMQNMYTATIPKGVAYFAMACAVALLIPIGVLLYTWIATMWHGAVRTKAPMLFALGAIATMTFGLAGELAYSVIPVGWQLDNTVAAQADTLLVLVGGSVLAGFAALHYWLPKVTGRYVGEGLAVPAFWAIVAGILVYAIASFFAGLEGQPVDAYRFFEGTGVDAYNLVASLGAFLLTIGVLVELANLAYSYGNGRPAPHDPWGGSTLEWFATSPPPPHNFDAVPDVRSPEPLHDIREAIRDRVGAFVPPLATPPPPSPEPERPPEPERVQAEAAGAERGDDSPSVA